MGYINLCSEKSSNLEQQVLKHEPKFISKQRCRKIDTLIVFEEAFHTIQSRENGSKLLNHAHILARECWLKEGRRKLCCWKCYKHFASFSVSTTLCDVCWRDVPLSQMNL